MPVLLTGGSGVASCGSFSIVLSAASVPSTFGTGAGAATGTFVALGPGECTFIGTTPGKGPLPSTLTTVRSASAGDGKKAGIGSLLASGDD
jgi:hypothetical protein